MCFDQTEESKRTEKSPSEEHHHGESSFTILVWLKHMEKSANVKCIEVRNLHNILVIELRNEAAWESRAWLDDSKTSLKKVSCEIL
jgi:hypothetical protein